MKMATWVKSYDHLKPNEAKKGVWHPCEVLLMSISRDLKCITIVPIRFSPTLLQMLSRGWLGF